MTGEAWVARGRDLAYERSRALEGVSAEKRFEGLLERHEGRLRGLVFAMLTDAGRVDDVLQETFFRAYRRLPARFANERQEAAWLYRIAYRCCLDELRRARRRPELPGLPEFDAATAAEEDVPSAVTEILAALPLDQRAVVLLVDLIGLDYETAASALGIPRGTAAWRLSLARSRLRTAYAKEEKHG